MKIMRLLFKKTDELIQKIDQFIDLTREASLHFQKALSFYFEGRFSEFEERMAVITETERNADSLKKDIEGKLYVQTLIPELRGDVLHILETMDRITNNIKHIVKNFSIERPEVPDHIAAGMKELALVTDKAVESLVFLVRTYFSNSADIRDYLHLVKYYEHDADILSEKTKRDIFSLDVYLSNKLQLKDFVSSIDDLADVALHVADHINIAASKAAV
jgi:predicted phosphate transport protein (TIGR00153 family)